MRGVVLNSCKRDIFDCIVQRMEQQDCEQATEYDGPQEDKENSIVEIFYYSEHFHAGKLVQLMSDLLIPLEC
mgnify:CR=1 FL=1